MSLDLCACLTLGGLFPWTLLFFSTSISSGGVGCLSLSALQCDRNGICCALQRRHDILTGLASSFAVRLHAAARAGRVLQQRRASQPAWPALTEESTAAAERATAPPPAHAATARDSAAAHTAALPLRVTALRSEAPATLHSDAPSLDVLRLILERLDTAVENLTATSTSPRFS